MTSDAFIVPQWRGPSRVRALFTTRAVDVPSERLRAALPSDPVWLRQVHGATCVEVDRAHDDPPAADAAVTRTPGLPITVRTADCLPVLLADRAGTVVGVAHAGWRGLAAGVLESALAALRVDVRDVAAWIGPGIGPARFEVGADVVDAYCANDPSCAAHFRPLREGKWLADLAGLAKQRLARAGVPHVAGGTWCTHSDAARFHSYRREKGTGRMALVAWIDASDTAA
ncbi:MAG: peptidoglycan editing factor PgeF [Burkholderiales bacterium]